ncbi:MAG: sugar ABC transporter permease, partial [Candidatus Omnitrophota bacterium]
MEKKAGLRKFLAQDKIRKFTMLIALVAIWLIFTFMTKGIFLTPRNLSNLFLQTATVAIIAIG